MLHLKTLTKILFLSINLHFISAAALNLIYIETSRFNLIRLYISKQTVLFL